MKKIVLGVVAVILLAAIIAAAVYWEIRPQIITLKDGTTLKLVAVTYGKHHSYKGIKLNQPMNGPFRRGRGMPENTNDTVVVWLEVHHKGGNQNRFGNQYQLFVYDPDNTACVATWQSMNRNKAGAEIQAFTLNAYPRRSSKMILRIGSWGNGGGMKLAKGQFVVPNPGPRSYPDWTPEPMPDTQSDGDLDVTMTKCVAGDTGIMFGGGDMSARNDPMHKSVRLAFHMVQNGSDATNWQPVAVETSDATGNQVGMYSWGTGSDRGDTNNDATINYQWGLWPSEPAWKLRVEMSRTSGFTDAETWSVTNVPVHKGTWQDLWNYQFNQRGQRKNSQTNSAFALGTVNGHQVSIFPVIQTTDQNWGPDQKPGGVRVVVDPELPEGYRMTVLATNERGRSLQSWGPNGGGGGAYVSQFQDLGNAKSVNLTIAIHKSRFVEFTVKPTTK